MTEEICITCRKPRASLKNVVPCGLCQGLVCKDCMASLDEDAFSFLREVPEDLSHTAYCGPCYDEKVAPAFEAYSEVMERAKDVGFFYKRERNLPPHRRLNKAVSVENCPDRKETLLRLAFFAAEQSCNALMNIDLHSKKVITSGYQKTYWSGTGFPAHVRLEKL